MVDCNLIISRLPENLSMTNQIHRLKQNCIVVSLTEDLNSLTSEYTLQLNRGATRIVISKISENSY